MINIRIQTILIFTSLALLSCIQPDKYSLWSAIIEKTIDTGGFARDIHMEGDTAFIAAGQLGIQIWNLDSETLIGQYESYGNSDLEDVSRIYFDKYKSLVFILDQSKLSFDEYDSTFFVLPTPIGDSHIEDFIVLSDTTESFSIYYVDRDLSDGFFWAEYQFSDPVWSLAPNSDNITSWTSPLKGLAIHNEYIAFAGDQLGVYLYTYTPDPFNLELISRIDTEGNAEKVHMTDGGIFVSCDDAGAYYIPIESFSGDGPSYRFAEDLTVDHIAVKDDIASLSLGSKGIALYDISDPVRPEEKGIFPIGYTYRTVFWKDRLLACTREGIQVVKIER